MKLTQSERMKAKWRDPEYRKRLSEAHKGKILSEETRLKISEAARNRSPISDETRKKMSEIATARWADPVQRAKMSNGIKEAWDPERRAKQSERLKILCADPAQRAKLFEISEAFWSDPEQRAKQSERIKALYTDPEFRERARERCADPAQRAKLSEISRAQWADPTQRAKKLEGSKAFWSDPAHRETHSKRMRAVWADPKLRVKVSGENAHLWRGGISFEPYPLGFNNYLKKKIKERDGCKCVLCDGVERLAVHHINYLKDDSREENLITLCVFCHGKTNTNRDYWESFLTELQSTHTVTDLPACVMEIPA